jgi:hypothetical protein
VAEAETPAEQAGQELVPSDVPAFALEREPIIDRIPQRQRKLLEARAPGLSNAELAGALELAWTYQLDPYANEVWFSKGRGRDGAEGRLLVMVGRDGLRKIAQRNGLDVDCDVVREGDAFRVERGADRSREVHHSYEGSAEQRGKIVGAWAEVWDRATGTQRGFFFAPLSEYMPTNENQRKYSPWGKQVSVMILAAAERQAVRQGTPLGGLLVEGEDVLVDERTGGAEERPPLDDQLAGVARRDEVVAVIERAKRLGHVGLADVGTAQMTLSGRAEPFVASWLEEAVAALDAMDAAPDEEVVDAVLAEEGAEGQEPADVAEKMREAADGLDREAADREEFGDAEGAAENRAEAERLRAEAAAIGDPAQPTLGV